MTTGPLRVAIVMLGVLAGACGQQGEPAKAPVAMPSSQAADPVPSVADANAAPTAAPAAAQDETDTAELEFVCRSHPGADSDQALRLAHVVRAAAGRSVFHDDREGCPASAGCERKAYLVPGDEVIVDRVAHGWACAWFAGARTPTMGYLHAADLDFAATAAKVTGSDWVGGWEQVPAGSDDPVATLLFSLHHDGLRVTGEALWYGDVVDGDRVVHTGSIEVEGLEADTDHTSFQPPDEYECGASFRLLGDYLVADDNGHCGGMNVTFDGIYQRSASRP